VTKIKILKYKFYVKKKKNWNIDKNAMFVKKKKQKFLTLLINTKYYRVQKLYENIVVCSW